MPQEALQPAGLCALALWKMLDEHDRQYWAADGSPLPLSTACVREAADAYNLSQEMQELALALDKEVCRMRREEREKKMKATKGK